MNHKPSRLDQLLEAAAAKCEHRLDDEVEWIKHRAAYNEHPNKSDGMIAAEVRMLFRDQLNHEAIVTAAANRICKLAANRAQLQIILDQIRREDPVSAESPPEHIPQEHQDETHDLIARLSTIGADSTEMANLICECRIALERMADFYLPHPGGTDAS